MKKTVLLQCVLCSFLLFVSLVLACRSNRQTAQAGAFGAAQTSNDTFEDLTLNLFEEFLNE